ncbi:MAG: TIGR03862 family flavoprotein [Rhodospirillales bacterium]
MHIDSDASATCPPVVIVGGGPAGLMAAEVLCDAGLSVDLYDAMPSLGRKFLMAGKSGLNLTHAEPHDDFVKRFAPNDPRLRDIINAYPPAAIRGWAEELGISTFTGSSGRVFPDEMKAAPLLRAWLKQLRSRGLRVHVRHRWTGWNEDGGIAFDTPGGGIVVRSTAIVLALGGASWPRLGSDGTWSELLASRGVPITPFQPSNCGFDVTWSDHLRERYQGAPVKGVTLRFHDAAARGDLVITADGLEGGPLYALSSAIVDAKAQAQASTISIDLLPDVGLESLSARLAKPRGKASLSNHLRKAAGLSGAKAALLYEFIGDDERDDPRRLASRIKNVPLTLERPRPIAEAISTAGGIAWDALSDDLELKALPGIFVAGEMLDWDAPTGGYLLTGCLASGRWAGQAVTRRFTG